MRFSGVSAVENEMTKNVDMLGIHVYLCLGRKGNICVKTSEIPLIDCDSNVYSYVCMFCAAPLQQAH